METTTVGNEAMLDTNVDQNDIDLETSKTEEGTESNQNDSVDWESKTAETERLLAAEKAAKEEQQRIINELRSQLSKEKNDKRSKEEILQEQLAANETKAKELEQKLARAEAARIFGSANINTKLLSESEMETFVTGNESETSALCTTVVSLIERIRKDTEKVTRKSVYMELDVPNTGDGKEQSVTKEEFSAMTYTQRSNLQRTNPALYEKLAGR